MTTAERITEDVRAMRGTAANLAGQQAQLRAHADRAATSPNGRAAAERLAEATSAARRAVEDAQICAASFCLCDFPAPKSAPEI